MSDPWLTTHIGDCREVLATLPAESVHCVVTSPPYWGLRDYGVAGQLGLEPTPEAYVEAMVGGSGRCAACYAMTARCGSISVIRIRQVAVTLRRSTPSGLAAPGLVARAGPPGERMRHAKGCRRDPWA